MMKVIQSPETAVCRNPYNGKWFIKFLHKPNLLKSFISFSSYDLVDHVYESMPYVDPNGKSYWQVKYFDAATEAQQYIHDNLYPMDLTDVLKVEAEAQRFTDVGVRNV